MSYLARFVLILGVSFSALARPVYAQDHGDWTKPAPKAAAPATLPATAQPTTIDIQKTIDEALAGPGTKDSATATANAGKADTKGDTKAAESFKSTPPEVKTPGGGGAQGGANESHGNAESPPPPPKPEWAIFVVGAALIVVGVALQIVPKLYPVLGLATPDAKVTIGMEAAGGVLCYAAFNPAIFIWLAIAAVAVLVGPTALHAIEAAKAKEGAVKDKSALDAVTDGMGLAPAGAVTPALVTSIKTQATQADLDHIHQTAAANGNPIVLSPSGAVQT